MTQEKTGQKQLATKGAWDMQTGGRALGSNGLRAMGSALKVGHAAGWQIAKGAAPGVGARAVHREACEQGHSL